MSNMVSIEELKQCRNRVKPVVRMNFTANEVRSRLLIKQKHDELDFQKEINRINQMFLTIQ